MRLANWKNLYSTAGVAGLIFLMYSLATMILLPVIGGQPETAQQSFAMLQQNRLVGLLRLDALTILIIPVYYPIFLALYVALKEARPASAALAALLAFAGLTLVLSTPSAFAWLALSDKFAAATDEARRTQLLAAGEAILAADTWHSSGALVGGMLMQTGALLASWIMLGSKSFSRWTAYIGIGMHGLDLLHILAGLFFPMAGFVLMAVAGPLYLAWFPLLARDFFRLAHDPTRQ